MHSPEEDDLRIGLHFHFILKQQLESMAVGFHLIWDSAPIITEIEPQCSDLS